MQFANGCWFSSEPIVWRTLGYAGPPNPEYKWDTNEYMLAPQQAGGPANKYVQLHLVWEDFPIYLMGNVSKWSCYLVGIRLEPPNVESVYGMIHPIWSRQTIVLLGGVMGSNYFIGELERHGFDDGLLPPLCPGRREIRITPVDYEHYLIEGTASKDECPSSPLPPST